MRALIAASLLALFLNGACSLPQVLLSERVEPLTTAESYPNRVVQRQVPLHIVNGFSVDEEAQIIAAVVDWNQNGAVRFDIAALNYATVEPGAWSVMKFDDTVHVSSGRCLEPAAITYRTSAGSGSIVVNVDRLGGRDLRAIIAHELGVASGNGDPERSPSCGASAVR